MRWVTIGETVTDQLVIAISKDGTITLNNEPILAAALLEKMRDQMNARSDKLVFFNIDDDANYGEVMHVMDLCRGAGAKTLGIMTKQ